jgi:ATP-dependent helicase/DNAse subunit B
MKKLDLHRTRHEDAASKVIRFIEEGWGSGDEIEIITGNSQKMKDIVTEVIDEYKLPYMIGRKFDLNNKGYVVVWLD